MKKLWFIVMLLLVLAIIGVYFYSTLNSAKSNQTSKYCGSWTPFGGEVPTCVCDGEIIKTGDRTESEGGEYECTGKIISKTK